MGRQSLITVILMWFLGAGVTFLVAIGMPRASRTTPDEVGHESSKLVAPDAAADDRFGTSVALCGDVALVGSANDDHPLPASGSAYMFDARGSFTHIQKLFAQDASATSRFGASVALNALTALIGAPADGARGEDAGAAYVFQMAPDRSWKQIAKLTSSDAAPSDQFGASVAIDRELAIVGSPRKGPGGAYLFRHDGSGQWNEIAKLAPGDSTAHKNFGASVAIAGSTVLVGAYGDNAAGTLSGAAYVFRCQPTGQWRQVAKLTALDASANSFFGYSLAIRGNTAVIGAHFDSAAQSNAGAAYIFRCDDAGSWLQIAKLTPADIVKGQQFGTSVALSGSNIVVGSPLGNHGSGAAYVFNVSRNGTWRQIAKYTASDASHLDWFSESVAISGDTVLIGAHQGDNAAADAGSAYVFQVTGVGNL
jgi:hypothetical protein